ncbi:hypothetical protein NQZ68_023275 [Dissostichus eleginoides]|nr:hypothetical protein NQZ68_023275 [Dissostichus eleginoides]
MMHSFTKEDTITVQHMECKLSSEVLIASASSTSSVVFNGAHRPRPILSPFPLKLDTPAHVSSSSTFLRKRLEHGSSPKPFILWTLGQRHRQVRVNDGLGGNPAQQEVVPSYPHMNSHAAVVSITCLLFSADTKSAAPSEPTHHTPADLWFKIQSPLSAGQPTLQMAGGSEAVSTLKRAKSRSFSPAGGTEREWAISTNLYTPRWAFVI